MKIKGIPILSRFLRREYGAASVEFVVVAPFYLGVFLSSFELAMMNIRAVMLERATDVVVRDLRLGTGTNPDYADVLYDVCRRTVVIPDCMNAVKIEMRPVDPATWTPLAPQIDCVKRDEDIQPDVSFENGQENEMMLVRVCAVVDPFFPAFGLGASMPLDDSGGYIVASSSAFVNEPL